VLRGLGLAEALGAEDGGDVCRALTDRGRDPATGVIAFGQLVEATAELAAEVGATLAAGLRPLVVGGDCSLLAGTLAGVRRAGLDIGLWFVDGHADYLDGASSPTGEAADMDLAHVTGQAPDRLSRVWGGGPLVAPERVALVGHRPATAGPDVADELARVPPHISRYPAPEVVAAGAEPLGEELVDRHGRAWLHLDLDVLDGEAFPAVSYPQPGGLGFDQLEALAAPLARAPGLAGISVADYNPGRDPGGRLGRRVVEMLGRLLRSSA
jgi:arginase